MELPRSQKQQFLSANDKIIYIDSDINENGISWIVFDVNEKKLGNIWNDI